MTEFKYDYVGKDKVRIAPYSHTAAFASIRENVGFSLNGSYHGKIQ